jgi:hypothetical protein
MRRLTMSRSLTFARDMRTQSPLNEATLSCLKQLTADTVACLAARRRAGGSTPNLGAYNRPRLSSWSSRFRPSEFYALKASGEPVALIDRGGVATQDLARSAANTSLEARATLEEMTDARYQTQNVRAAGVARNLSGGANATKTRARLIEDYDRERVERVPAYLKAYRDGDRPLWDEGFEQIAQAPAVQDAHPQGDDHGANDTAPSRLHPSAIHSSWTRPQAA